jgi:isoquinoline 1-oxidoreductase beta subunit
MSAVSRRDFIRFTTIAGSGLVLAAVIPGGDSMASGAVGRSPLLMPFLRIATDGTVTVRIPHFESGQGITTGLSTLVAEELGATWEQVKFEHADQDLMKGTGGSFSMRRSWEYMRMAGATAREMLVAAAAQRWRVPAAEISVDSGRVSHAASGRQAGFGEFAEAAGKLKPPQTAKLKDPSEFKLIGRERLPRVDTRAKSTGQQQYAMDVLLPGMMTAMVVRPPLFGATLVSFDATAAKRIKGVVDVVAIPRGVAVIARDTWTARRAREALQIQWDESAAERRSSKELAEELRRLSREPNAVEALAQGNPDEQLARAAKRFEADFEFPYLAHAAMEPLAAVCRLTADRCEVWAGFQSVPRDRSVAAEVAGLPLERVVLHTLAAGGSFGRRAAPDGDYVAEVVSIAKATKGAYPVRLVWTREDDITGGRYRPMNHHYVAAGLDAEGRVVAVRQRFVGQPVGMVPEGKVNYAAVEGHLASQYPVEHAHVSWSNPDIGVPVQYWRSVGHSHAAFSTEVTIDELAEAAGKDPIDFRLELLKDNPRAVAVLKAAAEKAQWVRGAAKVKGRGRGVAFHESFGSVVAQIVDVAVDGNGALKVERIVCVVDCGIAVNPDVVRAQMESGIAYGLSAAMHGAITLDRGRVEQSNFHDYPALRMREIPSAEIHIMPSALPPAGIGEPGTPPIAPAVANAIRAATGRKIRRLPFGRRV